MKILEIEIAASVSKQLVDEVVFSVDSNRLPSKLLLSYDNYMQQLIMAQAEQLNKPNASSGGGSAEAYLGKFVKSRSLFGHEYTKSCVECSGIGKRSCLSGCDQGIKQCDQCKGRKEYNCRLCQGSGHRTCDSCSGRGRVDVKKYEEHSVCRGTGKQGCSSCYGKGAYEYLGEVRLCNGCNGSGHVDCYGCTNGQVELFGHSNQCSSCSGSGRVDCGGHGCYRGEIICHDCDSQGKVKCTSCINGIVYCQDCRGSGQVRLLRRAVEKIILDNDSVRIVSNSLVENDLLPELNQHLQNVKTSHLERLDFDTVAGYQPTVDQTTSSLNITLALREADLVDFIQAHKRVLTFVSASSERKIFSIYEELKNLLITLIRFLKA